MTTASADSGLLLPAGTTMGAVTLYVRDLDLMTRYYREGVGLEVLSAEGDVAELGLGGAPVVRLVSKPGFHARPDTAPGLYHTAVLFDSRADLAAAILRVAQRFGGFTGSADHYVSLAFYFDDPEGNGVELYWDRPERASGWGPQTGVHMPAVIEYVDVNTFVREHLVDGGEGAREGIARVGHVHLKVAGTEATREFYTQIIGFEETLTYSGAVFMSAGSYHHHVAGNVWHSRNADPAGPALGLGELAIEVPEEAHLGQLAERLGRAGVEYGTDGRDILIADPWENRIRARVAGS